MKKQLETLNSLSKMIDFNLFYSIRYCPYDIILQGNKSALKEVNKVFETSDKPTEDGWIEYIHEYNGTKLVIILT